MKRLLVLAAVSAVMWIQSAGATIIVTLDSISPVLGDPGNYQWIYRASLQPDQNMRPGDFFTVYDIGAWTNKAGFQFSPNQDLTDLGYSFSTSVQLLGQTPSGTVPTNDSPSIDNVTVTLNPGALPNAAIIPGASSPQITLGNLYITSNTNQRTGSQFAGFAQKASDLSDVSNIGGVQVPVPEPTSISMLLAGLVAFGVIALRRVS